MLELDDEPEASVYAHSPDNSVLSAVSFQNPDCTISELQEISGTLTGIFSGCEKAVAEN